MSEVRVQMVKQPTVISMFAGCGGSSLGYKLAGFRELLAVEWDDNAVETFKLNFPDVPVYHGDIAKLTGSECMELAGIEKGELDVLDGSPPCQGFSTAGKRKFDDPRNSLFAEYARLIDELQPRVFVMENVTGMVKGYMKQAYLQCIKTLRECGYKAKGQVLNAKYYNVPQSRERVIIIGVRNDLGMEPSHPKPQTKPMSSRNYVIGEGIPLPSKYIETWKHTKPGETFFEGRNRMGVKPHSFDAQVLDPRKPAPTIKKQIRIGQSGLHHWERTEILNIESIKMLTSFPIEYNFTGKWQEQWARIGNSVPPNLMRAIAEHIKNNILKV